MNYKIHPTAEVQTSYIGDGTMIWQYSIVLSGAKIGANCNINFNCFIENDVVIGNNVTVKSGVQLWDGIVLGNDVFIGPNATFTNDLRPRSKVYPEAFHKTVVHDGASIGANATIVAGIEIGSYAMIGAGSVVTRSVPAYSLFYGNPAKWRGWIDEKGRKLIALGNELWQSEDGVHYREVDGVLTRIK